MGLATFKGGVLHESIDLSPWAGQRIELDFVYLTDTAGLGDGVLLDNFAIPAIGYVDDAENDDGGWEAEGFTRVQASVPQTFALVLLYPGADGQTRAEFHTFAGGAPFSVSCPAAQCSWAVTALNDDIRARTSYTIRTQP